MDRDDVMDECLKEMFKRVGEKYPNKKLTSKKEWYTLRTWTQMEEDSYRLWLKKRLRKAFPHLNSRGLDKESGYFLLMYGWKIDNTRGEKC